MDNNWYEFYKKRINSSYQRYFEFRYAPFLLEILKLNPKRIIEIGCGIGSVSKYLRGYNIECMGFDISENMVNLANENLNDIMFLKADIFNKTLSKYINYNLAISHGVLEHFTDEQILKIAKLYPNSIHYVPLDGYEKPSYGDERLLPKSHWDNLLNPSISFTFNDGKDLIFKI